MPYASKYYDPVKAHEYYMRTRQLKGYAHRYDNTDRSRGGSSVDVASVKNNSNPYSSEVVDRAQTVSSLTTRISDLRNTLNSLSPAEKRIRATQIRQEIKNLRAELIQARQNLRDSKQHERQNESSTSTAGFNEKGKEAAAYIQSQINDALDKENETLNNEFLSRIAEIKKRMDKRTGASQSSAIKSALKMLYGELDRRKSELRKSYQSKYADEIDKLRKDDSMHSYWDERKASK